MVAALPGVCGSNHPGSTPVMNQENRDPTIGAGVDPDEPPASTGGPHRSRSLQLWVNWALAALTVLGAGVVMVYFFGAVMSTAACSQKQCPHLGPDGISPDVLLYGPPVVAALTLVASFFTAQRRWGVVVPVAALALLGADIGILAATVAQ
jgi:hypothetical protein